MRRISIFVPLAMAGVLVVSAGCGGKAEDPATAPTISTELGPTSEASAAPGVSVPASAAKSPPKASAANSPAAAAWPTPEDCVSYNPAALAVNYAAGIYSVNEGSKVVARVHGGPGEDIGRQALAVAQRFRKHCYLGRDNTREEKGRYIFDYWRDASGQTPAIPGLDDLCSNYDRGQLTADDMGGGHGWRVRENDHVLHELDNERDARNAKLVAAKYGRICFIGGNDDGQDQVSFFL
jgi:hypothetical protein